MPNCMDFLFGAPSPSRKCHVMEAEYSRRSTDGNKTPSPNLSPNSSRSPTPTPRPIVWTLGPATEKEDANVVSEQPERSIVLEQPKTAHMPARLTLRRRSTVRRDAIRLMGKRTKEANGGIVGRFRSVYISLTGWCSSGGGFKRREREAHLVDERFDEGI